jgi:hypothetical protein
MRSIISFHIILLRRLLTTLKLFQEWGQRGIKENCGGGEFKYDTFDVL